MINIEDSNEYKFITNFFKLIITRSGWEVRDVLDNKVDETDVLSILFTTYGTDSNVTIIYNTWLKRSMKLMTKPLQLFLKDYRIENSNNTPTIINKETGVILNLQKDFLPYSKEFSLSIIKQTVMYWLKENR